MALHFLIDGYNLLYALPELPAGSLQDKRGKLLTLLKQGRPHGKNPLTVIFDSRQGDGNQVRDDEVTVVFTSGETADDWISAYVRRSSQPQTLMVVSNDQGIRRDVKGAGAQFMSADDFLKDLKVPSPTPAVPKQSSPASEAITEEFKKRWL